jgi:subtilisin family serine protease
MVPPLLLVRALLSSPWNMQLATEYTRSLNTAPFGTESQYFIIDPPLAVRDPITNKWRFLRDLAAVDTFFHLPSQHNVLSVAAAGNDSRGGLKRFGPRLPAAVQGVLGVSSMEVKGGAWPGDLSLFSNNDDIEMSRDDAISAFGGSIVRNGGHADTDSGPVGIAIVQHLPPRDTETPNQPDQSENPNNDGWARWAGTSFATPVVSGLAACLWAELGHVPSPTELMRLLVGISSGSHREIPLVQQP